MNIEELKELINNINNQQDVNSIADGIVKHFAEVSNIDLDEYVYKDGTEETETETPAGGEADEQV